MKRFGGVRYVWSGADFHGEGCKYSWKVGNRGSEASRGSYISWSLTVTYLAVAFLIP